LTKELLTVHQYCVSKVLQTGDDLGEVTETVDYNVQASTIAAGNLFGRYGPLLIKSFSFVTLLIVVVQVHAYVERLVTRIGWDHSF